MFRFTCITSVSFLLIGVTPGVLSLARADQVAYWAFDGVTVAERLEESLGQTSVNATESGGTSSWNTRSGFGNVLANGVGSQYLTVPHQSLLDPGTESLSISLWAYRTSDVSRVKGLVDFLSSSATSGYQLFYQADNTIRIRIDDTSGNTKNIDTTASHYTANTWQNIIVTVDRTADKVKIYVNGIEATSAGGVSISNITGSIIPDQHLAIGTSNDGTASRGQFDDLGLFNSVLTSAEIAAINANGGTPLSQISFTTTRPVEPVSFTPSSGVLRPGETVTIVPAGTVDAIYYTLDGSDPDSNASLYSSPLTLPAGGELRAVAYSNNLASDITSGHFSVIPATAPNIVLVIADDVGFGDLSCNGSPTIYTPNLDKLARNGTRFTQWTNCGPGDLANQYALLTGRVPRRGGLPESLNTGAANGIDIREWTLAEALRKSGYQTAMVGAWYLGDTVGSKPGDQGFQLFYGLPYRPDAVPSPPLIEGSTTLETTHNPLTLLSQMTERAKGFINAQSADPFFLVFHPPSLPATGSSLNGSYGDQVEALDDSLGQLRDTIESAGHTANTLVIFLSDEGPDLTPSSSPFGSAGLFKDGKSTTWEGGVRVPAMASWPGVIPVASDNYAPIWSPDLYVSLTQIANAYTPQDRPYDGTGVAETLLAGRTRPDANKSIYLHRHDGSDYQLQAVRKGSWKYHISYQNSDPQNTFSTAAPLLFQVEVDPTEHINRSSSHPSILSDLQQAATSYQATFAAPILQLPAAKSAFLGTPSLLIQNPSMGPDSFTSSFIRPKESLNDHYAIEYSYDLTSWSQLSIDDYITSITSQPGDSEVIELSLPLNTPEFSPTRYFIRLSATRP